MKTVYILVMAMILIFTYHIEVISVSILVIVEMGLVAFGDKFGFKVYSLFQSLL